MNVHWVRRPGVLSAINQTEPRFRHMLPPLNGQTHLTDEVSNRTSTARKVQVRNRLSERFGNRRAAAV